MPASAIELFPNFYMPSNYLKEIVIAKGNSAQLSQYFALILGIKPLLDDWVYSTRIAQFERACALYGLHITTDSMFVEAPHRLLAKSIGAENLTTTKFFGAPFSSARNGQVHVFVSKSKKTLERGKRYGWYPLSIHGRILTKPLIDHYNFGKFLGYPKCCRDFFMEYNDHSRYSNTLYLPFKNTKNTPSFLCNSLTKDSYSYVYNIPCSFDCEHTIKYASALRNFILRMEPNYAQLVDAHLKLVFLVFKERDIYAFQGKQIKRKIFYNNCYFADASVHSPRYISLLKKGNEIEIKHNRLAILSSGHQIAEIPKTAASNWFVISFGGYNAKNE